MQQGVIYNPNNNTYNNTLKKGYWDIALKPRLVSDLSDMWTMYNVPSGSYVVYSPKSNNGPAIHVLKYDQELINFTNYAFNQNFSTVKDCLDFYFSSNKYFCQTKNDEIITIQDLQLYFDVGNLSSYPTTGNKLMNLSNGKFEGTLIDGVSYAPVSSGVLNFSNDSSRVAIDGFYYNSTISNISIELWFNTSMSNKGIIASFDDNEYWEIYIDSNGYINIDYLDESGQVSNLISTQTVNNGSWYQFTFTFESNNQAKIYLNGSLENSQNSSSYIGSGNTRYGFLGLGSEATSYDGTKSSSSSGSVENIASGWVTAPTSTGIISENIGFQPDLIIFQATNSITSGNTGAEGSMSDDYGWCHGASDFNNNQQISIFLGTGSSSPNGMAAESESNNSYCINILELAGKGNSINNRIQATATQTSIGFDLDFKSVGNAEMIEYKAYKFNNTGGVEIGFFNALTSTGTQSISTSINPDFVKFITQPRLTASNETLQDQNDWGLGHGWLTSSNQYSMSFASYAFNVSDFGWGSRDNKCLLIKHAESKGGVTGTTEATGSLVTGGFDLNYTNVEGTGELVMYIAMQASEGFELTYTNAPQSAVTDQNINGSFRDLNTTANAGIDQINTDGFYDNPNFNDHINYGWSHGIADSPSNQHVLSLGFSIASINAHRYFGSSGELIRLLFTNRQGNDEGSDDAYWKSDNTNSIVISFTAAVDGSGSGVSTTHSTNPIVLWGVKKSNTYNGYNGAISNIKIYNRSLTQQEITDNFNALKSKFGL